MIKRWVPGVRAAVPTAASGCGPTSSPGSCWRRSSSRRGWRTPSSPGLPLVTGLYTTIGCLVGYAIFGPSRVLVLGPDSSVSPLIFAAIVPLVVTDDPKTAIALAGMLALLVGVIEIAMGSRSSASSPTCCRARCRSAT